MTRSLGVCVVIALGLEACAAHVPTLRERMRASLRPARFDDLKLLEEVDADSTARKRALFIRVCEEVGRHDPAVLQRVPCVGFVQEQQRPEEDREELARLERDNDELADKLARGIVEGTMVDDAEAWQATLQAGPADQADRWEAMLARRRALIEQRFTRKYEQLAAGACHTDGHTRAEEDLAAAIKASAAFGDAMAGMFDRVALDTKARCAAVDAEVRRRLASSRADALDVVREAIANGVPAAAASRVREAADELIARGELEEIDQLAAEMRDQRDATSEDKAAGAAMAARLEEVLATRYRAMGADAVAVEASHPALAALLRLAMGPFRDELPPPGPRVKAWMEFSGRFGVASIDTCYAPRGTRGLVAYGLTCSSYLVKGGEVVDGPTIKTTSTETYRTGYDKGFGNEHVRVDTTMRTTTRTQDHYEFTHTGDVLQLDLGEELLRVPVGSDGFDLPAHVEELRLRAESELKGALVTKAARLLAAARSTADPVARADLYAQAYLLNPERLEEARAFFVAKYELRQHFDLNVEFAQP